MSKQSARDRLAEAAFAMFAERGYEQTSIDDITERAWGGPRSSGTTGRRKTSSSPTTTSC